MFDAMASAGNNNRLREIFLRINPARFHTLKFILEGYDNLALLSSVSRKANIVRLRYPEDLGEELFEMLSSIASDIRP